MRRAAAVPLLLGVAAASWLACTTFSASNDGEPTTEGGADTAGPAGDSGAIDAADAADATDATGDGSRRVVSVDHFENGTCGAWQATGGILTAVAPGRGSAWACQLCRTLSGELSAHRPNAVDAGAGTYQLEFYARDPDGGGLAAAGVFVYYDGGQDNIIGATVPLADWTLVQATNVSTHDGTGAQSFAFNYDATGCILIDDATLFYYPP